VFKTASALLAERPQLSVPETLSVCPFIITFSTEESF